MNLHTILLFTAWSAIAGGVIPVMAALNGSLGRSIGSPIHAALILGVGGVIVMAGVLLVVRPAMPTGAAFASVPPMAWFAGVAMAIYAISATYLAPRFGVGNFVICVVVAQLVVSSVIDQFGLFGAPVYPIGIRRLIGLLVLGAGAALVAIK
jgi:transporter family-2 protein